MEFHPFAGPSSPKRNRGPWRVEDVVSPLRKPIQSKKKIDFSLKLGSSSSPPTEEHVIPRVLGHCDMCLITETPQWRKGPNGLKTLCNACGLRYAKELKKVKLTLGDKPSTGLALGDKPLTKLVLGNKHTALAKSALGAMEDKHLAEDAPSLHKIKKVKKEKLEPKEMCH